MSLAKPGRAAVFALGAALALFPGRGWSADAAPPAPVAEKIPEAAKTGEPAKAAEVPAPAKSAEPAKIVEAAPVKPPEPVKAPEAPPPPAPPVEQAKAPEPAKPAAKAKSGPNLLHMMFGNPAVKAADSGDVEALARQLDRGMDIEATDDNGRTLLSIAVAKGRLKAVQLLISRNANVNVADATQKTALMYACDRGNTEIALALIEAGADINARTPDDRNLALRRFTPLMFAARTGQTMIIDALLKKGVDIDALDNNNMSALSHAEENGNIEVVRQIEKAKADRALAAAGPAVSGGGIDAAKIAAAAAQAVLSAQESKKPAAPVEIVSDVDKPKYHLAEDPKKFALVIGIGKYSDIPEAQFAERDAKAVAAHLEAMGYPRRNIISLVGEKATRTGLLKNLETWLPLNVSEGSTVFFYFSGHGAPDTGTGEAYLVPWDGDPLFLKDTAYPIKRLYEKLSALKAKRVIVAMDSCFSGAGGRSVLAKGARPLVSKVDMGSTGSDKIVALSASQADQISGTIEDQGHGAFTYFLLKGLNGEAFGKGGGVTLDGLYEYLTPKVQDAARRQNREQTPQFIKSGGLGGEILR